MLAYAGGLYYPIRLVDPHCWLRSGFESPLVYKLFLDQITSVGANCGVMLMNLCAMYVWLYFIVSVRFFLSTEHFALFFQNALRKKCQAERQCSAVIVNRIAPQIVLILR